MIFLHSLLDLSRSESKKTEVLSSPGNCGIVRSMRLFTLFMFLGCAAEPQDTSDSSIVDSNCVDAQIITYNNFGKSFMTHGCQGCHASTAPDRYGAPIEVVFDTLDLVWDQAATILAVAAGDQPTMPPQGGVTVDDRIKLKWWLECGEEGL